MSGQQLPSQQLPSQQLPSIGRIVHWFAFSTPGGNYPASVPQLAGAPRAAIITEVDQPGNPESPVGLCVFNPMGAYFTQHVPYSPGQPGHWGWPPYIPPATKTPAENEE